MAERHSYRIWICYVLHVMIKPGWRAWARGMSGVSLVTFVRDEVFAFYAEVAERSAVNFMDGARLVIDEPTVLAQVITLID